ncbi:hypothetical protein GCM10023322_02980 [Rugosimonospora acidiphila]|uniref:LPXTG cell wall anchor domain-containing protein n=1 Tax=Rugosimonospora acidiphila TaxID=556531 RepID=A0ABP9RIP8_9ACTN
MRVLRPASAVLFGAVVLTGIVLTGSPAISAPGDDASLRVTPDQGAATSVFVVRYRMVQLGMRPGSRLACPLVQFEWDGAPLSAALRAVRQNGVCVATLRARPPARDRAPGPHRIEVPGLLGLGARAVTYTVLGPASPTPARTASPAARALSAPTRSATAAADPTVGDPPSPSLSIDPVVPLPSDSPVEAMTVPGAGGGGSAAAWVMIVGGSMVLAGVGLLGLLIYRSRRAEAARDLGFDPEIPGLYE